jgi:ligand-binding sensor domain-containing protein
LAEIWGVTLYLAPDGGLWLGTDYEGVWRFDGQSWSRYAENETPLRSGYITSLAQDDDGVLWVGAYEMELLSFDGQTLRSWVVENEPAFNNAQQILETDDGRLWFVKKYGGPEIAIYSPADDTWDTFQTPGDTQAMAFDPDGSFWFGTNDGLWRVTPDGERQRFSTDDGLPGNNITALAFDDNGGLWVGADAGLVYHQPDDAEVPWRNFTDYIPSPHVTTLYLDPTGQVWVGLAAVEDRPAGVVRAVDGVISDIWLAGDETPEALQPIEPSIVGHPFPAELVEVTAFALDANNQLWVGSWNGGLWRLSLDSGEWRTFNETDGALAANVLTITVDDDGTVWFGTWYDGLWAYNEAEGWWQDGPEDGLPSFGVFASYAATDGSLWVATDNGLARHPPE